MIIIQKSVEASGSVCQFMLLPPQHHYFSEINLLELLATWLLHPFKGVCVCFYEDVVYKKPPTPPLMQGEAKRQESEWKSV